MPHAAARALHDYRCAVTCDAASGRGSGKTVDRHGPGHTANSACAGKAAFNCCGSDKGASPGNDAVSDDRSTDGRRPVLNRSASQVPVPRRHGRVGQPRFQGLSLCRDAELWDDQERCVHVRERRHEWGVSSRQE